MANTLLTPTMITREALRILHQKLNFVGNINREYDDRFAKTGAKIGDTLQIRLPNQYVVRSGTTMSAQDTTEQKVDLVVGTRKGVDMTFSSTELTLSLDDFTKRILDPAVSVLAANIEADALTMYKDVSQQINGIGAPLTFKKLLEGRKRLNDSLAPNSGRNALLNTTDNIDLVDALKGLFQDSSGIAKQYKEGMMGRTAGFDFWENTLLPSHARGAANGSYLVNNAATAEGASTLVVDTGTGAMAQGEIFTIANVFDVHPETKASTGVLKQFTVTAAYAGGAGTVSFAPAIYAATVGRKNVSALPADNAAITIQGTASTNYGVSMLYHPDAFTFVTADLELPDGRDFAAREQFEGISMRIIRDYSISDDTFPCRLDVHYGFKAIRPQLAVRLAAN